jgi:hypothetical protein
LAILSSPFQSSKAPLIQNTIRQEKAYIMSAQPPAEQPWHAAFPAPRNTARSISREEMLQWMREGKQPGKDYVLVDLRRNDHEVSCLPSLLPKFL